MGYFSHLTDHIQAHQIRHVIKTGLSDTIQLIRLGGAREKTVSGATHLQIISIFSVHSHKHYSSIDILCCTAPLPVYTISWGDFGTGTCAVEDSAKLTSLHFSLASIDFEAASRTRRGFDVVGALSTLAGLDLRPGMPGRRLHGRYQTGGNG